jgi:hypothetical protein
MGPGMLLIETPVSHTIDRDVPVTWKKLTPKALQPVLNGKIVEQGDWALTDEVPDAAEWRVRGKYMWYELHLFKTCL